MLILGIRPEQPLVLSWATSSQLVRRVPVPYGHFFNPHTMGPHTDSIACTALTGPRPILIDLGTSRRSPQPNPDFQGEVKCRPDPVVESPDLPVMQAEDVSGRLAISFAGPGALLVDVVSLMPDDNVLKGGLNPWPFREDLMQRMRDLKPRRDAFPIHKMLPHRDQWYGRDISMIPESKRCLTAVL